MEFRPRVWPGTLIGATGVAALIALSVLLVWRIASQPVSLVSFVAGLVVAGMLAGAVLFSYWTLGCVRLRYHIDHNRLALRWGWNTHFVPLSSIATILPGARATAQGSVEGISWPGHYAGRAEVEGVGETVFLSAHLSPLELLYIVTPTLAYAISVPDPQRFSVELRLRQMGGSNETFELSSERPSWYDLALLRDWIAFGLLVLGLLTNIALFAYICYAFPSLPELLPLRYSPLGVVEQIGLRSHVFTLPLVSLVLLTANTVLGAILYSRERVGAYLCLGSGVLIQGLMGAAIIRIVG